MVKDRASKAMLPMTGRSRGIVVTLRRRQRPDARRMPRWAPEAAKKRAPCVIRLYESPDAVLNAEWDRFLTLVLEAWCWRDLDCVAAIEDALAHLRRSVDHDWS